MAIIVKCNPPRGQEDDEFEIEARVYQEVVPTPGDEVFVWTAETRGGQGLNMRGVLQAVDWIGRRRTSLRIRVVDPAPFSPLNNAMLREHRNSHLPTPISRLAAKLYRYSLNKVARLDADEAMLLQQYFFSGD